MSMPPRQDKAWMHDPEDLAAMHEDGAGVLSMLASTAVQERRAAQLTDEVVMLQQCKHLDRATHTKQCHEALHVRAHKRGHLMVVCAHNHQWVWCSHCCDCGLGSRGCIMPAHWMQRDAYDTGKRNHLQQHNEVANKRFKIREHQRKTALCANSLVADKGFAYFSAVGTGAEAPGPSINSAANPTEYGNVSYLGAPVLATARVGAALKQPEGSDCNSLPDPSPTDPGLGGLSIFNPASGDIMGLPPMLTSPALLSHTIMARMAEASERAAAGGCGGGGETVPGPPLPCAMQGSDTRAPAQTPAASHHLLQILERCKHVDRKRDQTQCKCRLRTRNHKRGHLAIVCEAGHQWVWCPHCCGCAREQVGCSDPNHWMERDCFDTGTRNHMQRHLDDWGLGGSAPVSLATVSTQRVLQVVGGVRGTRGGGQHIERPRLMIKSQMHPHDQLWGQGAPQVPAQASPLTSQEPAPPPGPPCEQRDAQGRAFQNIMMQHGSMEYAVHHGHPHPSRSDLENLLLRSP